jgi:hypothetical protein
MHPGLKRRRLFFMQGWDRYGFRKNYAVPHYTELVFLQPVRSACQVVHSGASRVRKIDALFSCSGGTGSDSTKTELGHVTPNLCFCSWWDLRVT